MVEQGAVNAKAVGSIPTSGANGHTSAMGYFD